MPLSRIFTSGSSLPAAALNDHAVHVLPAASTGGFYKSQTASLFEPPVGTPAWWELSHPAKPITLTRAGLVVEFNAAFRALTGATSRFNTPTLESQLTRLALPAEFRPSQTVKTRAVADGANSLRFVVHPNGACLVGGYGPGTDAIGKDFVISATWIVAP